MDFIPFDASQEGFQKREVISSIIFELAKEPESVLGTGGREVAKKWRGLDQEGVLWGVALKCWMPLDTFEGPQPCLLSPCRIWRPETQSWSTSYGQRSAAWRRHGLKGNEQGPRWAGPHNCWTSGYSS